MFKPTMNFSRGFAHLDFVRGQESDNWKSGDPKLVEAQLARHVRQPVDMSKHAGLVNYLLNQRHRKDKDDYQCARVFNSACAWLADNHTAGPFFLWVDSFDPHEPWDPPPEYADRYFEHDGLDFIVPGPAYARDGSGGPGGSGGRQADLADQAVHRKRNAGASRRCTWARSPSWTITWAGC